MAGKVSIKDIALEVGVSTTLVSFVLNGKAKQMRVGDEVAARIEETAGKMGYQPNLMAKGLRIGKSQTIGLVVADISNPFFAQLARAIEDEAAKHSFTVIFGSYDEEADKMERLVKVLLAQQVAGLIIVPSADSEPLIKSLIELSVPFVLVDRFFPGLETDYVMIDNYQASRLAVQHLIESGNRRIAMFAFETPLVHMQERIKAYQDALDKFRMIKDRSLLRTIRFKYQDKEVELAIKELVIQHKYADAIYFATNTLAMSGLEVILKNKLHVPEDVNVVSFDNNESFKLFASPVSHNVQPVREMAERAVTFLMKSVTGHSTGKQQVRLNTSFIHEEKVTDGLNKAENKKLIKPC